MRFPLHASGLVDVLDLLRLHRLLWPFAGYFGETLQADIVFLRLIDGKNVPVLEMTCEANSYHDAKALRTKNPDEVLKAILEIWYRALGLPLGFKADPGGEFGGEVLTFHTRHGILHETIPAEAHHRIGRIERRNALLRTIVERIVDERGVATIEMLDVRGMPRCSGTHYQLLPAPPATEGRPFRQSWEECLGPPEI